MHSYGAIIHQPDVLDDRLFVDLGSYDSVAWEYSHYIAIHHSSNLYNLKFDIQAQVTIIE